VNTRTARDRVARALLILGGCFLIGSLAAAAPPPLRDQVSLNGTWSFIPEGGSATTIDVPDAWDAAPGFDPNVVTTGIYEREVSVPPAWTGKVVKLEFDGVSHVADVYVNDLHLLNHLGGWIPFAVDVTGLVTPGEAFDLRVEVKGGSHPPIVNDDGFPVWPVGWIGHRQQWGITFGVWLRAYGTVHIEDAFIQTSFRNRTITVDYALTNSDSLPRTVTVVADVTRSEVVERSISGPAVELAAGETRVVQTTSAWEDPALWSPETPELYLLESRLVEDMVAVDTEVRRFGFREIWIEGNQLVLNGTRLNLWGDNMTVHAQGMRTPDRYQWMSPETWPATVDTLLGLNIRLLRPHQQPAPAFVLDVADEKGLMIVEESAIYSRLYYSTVDKDLLLENCLQWIPPWVKARRNHPSIVLWSAENEMQLYGGHFTSTQLRMLGDEIRELDPTRPVIYDGDGAPNGDAVINRHYPEGYNNSWSGSIYKLTGANNSTKPYGYGEYLTDYGPDGNRWWQGTVTRGLRYTNFTDLRPFKLFWAWDGTADEISNLSHSLAPVALFDKAYDDLGIEPLRSSAYPTVDEGEQLSRTLILYNDELSDTTVTVEVVIQVEETVYATGITTGTLELGEHVDIPYEFEVPYTGDSIMEVVLRTWKGEVKKFEEARRFYVAEAGTGETSEVVGIDWGGEPVDTIFADDFESGNTSSWSLPE
jgi:hypothetical protein